VLLLRTAETVGLIGRLSEALVPWRKRFAVHDPGKIVLDLAIAVAVAGDCLADVGMLCTEPGVFGAVASDPTVSRIIATLASDAPKAVSAIRSARAAAREAAWDRAAGTSRSSTPSMAFTVIRRQHQTMRQKIRILGYSVSDCLSIDSGCG
jgi:hypothetical protein